MKIDAELKKAKDDKMLLTLVKRENHNVCYYLKPIPSLNTEEYLIDNMPLITSQFNPFSDKYSAKKFSENYNFFGKTLIPITHFFNKEFLSANGLEGNRPNSQSLKHLKQLYENLNVDGEYVDIINVEYQQNNEKFNDYFIIYDKESVIKNSQKSEANNNSLNSQYSNNNLKNNNENNKAQVFLDSLDSLRQNICINSICENFFIDENKRLRYETVLKELSIYNSFFNDHVSRLSNSADKSLLANYESLSENQAREIHPNFDFRTSTLSQAKLTEKEFEDVLNGMLKKTYSGYFLHFANNYNFYSRENQPISLRYFKEKSAIIPPLMKIYGNDKNFFAKLFNSITFNSNKNNLNLSISDFDDFKAIYNPTCYQSILETSYSHDFYYKPAGKKISLSKLF